MDSLSPNHKQYGPGFFILGVGWVSGGTGERGLEGGLDACAASKTYPHPPHFPVFETCLFIYKVSQKEGHRNFE